MITLILIILSSSLSWATVTVQDVSGASKWNLVSNNVEIFGGFAGDEDANCILNADGTCNNCLSIASTGTLTACNETRAMLNSGLTISIKSDSITGSGPIIMAASDSASNQIGLDGDTVSKDVTGSVTVPWTTICTTLLSSGAGSSCATSLNPYGSFTLRVGIDTNNDNNIDSDEDYTDITVRTYMPSSSDAVVDLCSDTSPVNFNDGICSFTAFPGDEKFYVKDIEPVSQSFPNLQNIQFDHARFFYSTSGFSINAEGPNPGSSFGYTDIPLEVDDSKETFLSSKSVNGLSNDNYYFVRMAMVDQANNVAFFTSDRAIETACGKTIATLTSDDDQNCQFIVKPDEVVGLLTEDLNCFIATAAYGSNMNSYLKTLREFRNKILLQSNWGKKFVKKYYQYGPIGSKWIIKQGDWVKFTVRSLLIPIWIFAKISLQFGVFWSVFILVLTMSLFILTFKKVLNFKKKLNYHNNLWLLLLLTYFLFQPHQFAFAQNDEFPPTIEVESNFFEDQNNDLNSTESNEELLSSPDISKKNKKNLGNKVIENNYEPIIQDNLISRESQELPPSTNQIPKADPNNPNVQKIPHPYAEKGLTRITKDGIYEYEVKPSEQKNASSVRLGNYDPTELTNPDGYTFEELYPESSSFILLYDYEWQVWKGALGKIGWKLGTGLYYATGNGAFRSEENASLTPEESFTFVAFPNNLSGIYRFQMWDNQWLVPFIDGGLDAITFMELRDDNQGPKFGFSPAAHIAGGASLDLGVFDKRGLISLDQDYGINSVWLTVEFRALIALSNNYDFSGNIISAGILAEF